MVKKGKYCIIDLPLITKLPTVIPYFMSKKIFFSLCFSLACGLFFAADAKAATFDPNSIISDAEMLDNTSMTLADIDLFLKSKGGYIATRQFKNHEGDMKSMAQIIYEAANNYDCSDANVPDYASYAEKRRLCKQVNLNPKVLLVLLQKEQSLIEETSPTQRQMDWALGYGCPDNQACNKRWEGIGKQINSAALQFNSYMTEPQNYTYKAGGTYTVTNTGRAPMTIKPANQATAALYNYTPHVYWGNFNFYKLWLKYFTRLYPNNTLVQVKGEPGVWQIKNGQRRPFLSMGALTTRFDREKIVQIDASDLEKYPIGPAIKFPNYSLIRVPSGTIYLLVDDKKHAFTNYEAFRSIGYNPEEIIDGAEADLAAYEDGKMLTEDSSYPLGALLQDKSTGGVFYVYEGTKAPLWDKVLLSTKFKRQAIQPVESAKLAAYETVSPAIFNDGELLKTESSPGVYVIDNGQRRVFASGDIFEELGYKWSNIIIVPEKIMNLYEKGDPITKAFAGGEVEIIDPNAPDIATGTDDILPEDAEEMIEEEEEEENLSVEDIITRMIYGK